MAGMGAGQVVMAKNFFRMTAVGFFMFLDMTLVWKAASRLPGNSSIQPKASSEIASCSLRVLWAVRLMR